MSISISTADLKIHTLHIQFVNPTEQFPKGYWQVIGAGDLVDTGGDVIRQVSELAELTDTQQRTVDQFVKDVSSQIESRLSNHYAGLTRMRKGKKNVADINKKSKSKKR